MAFPASDLKAAMQAYLGTFGTQRYLDQPHFIPAIQAGMRRFKALVGGILANNKGAEELFGEVSFTRIFQTSAFGDIRLRASQLGHQVWTVVAIYPEPITRPDTSILPAPPQDSLYRSDLSLLAPGKFPCQRLTAETAAIAQGNRFMSGNEILAPGPRRSYAYYIRGDKSLGYQSGDIELIVAPQSICGQKLMGVTYLMAAEPITSMASIIPYPQEAFELLKQLALHELSVRQGAQPLFVTTINEARTLLGVQA